MYESIWIDQKPQILAAARRVRAQHPEAWAEVKLPKPHSRRFINLVALECQETVSEDIGCNLKRGGPELSLDVLAMPNASGCRDASGKYAGLELIDIVPKAESPNADIDWIDVTQDTINANVPGGWKQPTLSGDPVPPTPPPMPTQPPGREEALDELSWLHRYYQTPEGLQRPQGLWRPDLGTPDFEGIAAWYLDVYQKNRMAMKSRADSRAAYVKDIRNSDEWKAKHPGETP